MDSLASQDSCLCVVLPRSCIWHLITGSYLQASPEARLIKLNLFWVTTSWGAPARRLNQINLFSLCISLALVWNHSNWFTISRIIFSLFWICQLDTSLVCRLSSTDMVNWSLHNVRLCGTGTLLSLGALIHLFVITHWLFLEQDWYFN